jgi:hypothetical protein
MRKLRLDPDALRVESFATDPRSRAAGTVAAHVDLIGAGGIDVMVPPNTMDAQQCLKSWIETCVTAEISKCPGETCGDALTCGASCQATCETCLGPTCDSCGATRCLVSGPVYCCV